MTELPYNLDAERATLGAVFLNRDALVVLAPQLAPEHFYDARNSAIYQAMLDCYGQRITPDYLTVRAALQQRGQRSIADDLGYLTGLSDVPPSSANAPAYAEQVTALARRRTLIATGGKIAALGYNEHDADAAEASAQAALTAALTHPGTGGYVPIGETSGALYDALVSGQRPGTPTGYRDLDEMTGGLHAGELTILASRPSVGKTSLALCLAANVAERGGLVLFSSLEMDRNQLLLRLIALRTRTDLHRLRINRLGSDQAVLDSLVDAFGWADALPVLVDETSGATVAHIRANAMRARAERGPIALLVVDYLQLMADVAKKNGTREQDVSAISRGLKHMARELECPVLALSQLSRAVEGRQSHIPMLSDLRESGSLEQDADNVLFIYRDELYDQETDKRGVAEVHISKQRQGPIGIVPLRFDPTTTRFDDLSSRERDQ